MSLNIFTMKYIGLLYWRYNQLSTSVFFTEILNGEKEKWTDKENDKQAYTIIYIIATEIAGNYLFPWKGVNWLTCSINYIEVIGENIKNIK